MQYLDGCAALSAQAASSVDVDGELRLVSHYAGHVLGAVMVSAECHGQRVVYTGDFNTTGARVHAHVRTKAQHTFLLFLEVRSLALSYPLATPH